MTAISQVAGRTFVVVARDATVKEGTSSPVGWWASGVHELSFTECRVPAAPLIGTEVRGGAQLLWVLDEGCTTIPALSTGLAQGSIDKWLRSAFGRSIGQYQAIQFNLSDIRVWAHTAGLTYYEARG